MPTPVQELGDTAPARLRETDLYGPVREYLEAQGYAVRSEVRGCDIAATRDGELVVVELKRGVTVDLLVQATERQHAADGVYVAVPRPSSAWLRRHWRGVRRLLRRLELGVLFVDLGATPPAVWPALHPLPYTRRRNHRTRRGILQEAAGRSVEMNCGGSNGQKLMTAYRENALFIACCLERGGAMRPAQLRALGTGPKTLSILSRNVYQWFQRVDRGVYALTPQGRAALDSYPDLVQRFRDRLDAAMAPAPAGLAASEGPS